MHIKTNLSWDWENWGLKILLDVTQCKCEFEDCSKRNQRERSLGSHIKVVHADHTMISRILFTCIKVRYSVKKFSELVSSTSNIQDQCGHYSYEMYQKVTLVGSTSKIEYLKNRMCSYNVFEISRQ